MIKRSSTEWKEIITIEKWMNWTIKQYDNYAIREK